MRRFHQPYRLQVARPPFDYIDVVTPFRRVVLITEERTNLGIRGFTNREAAARARHRLGVVEIRVDMTFHPQNVFIGVPGYDVELTVASTRRAADAAGGDPHPALWRSSSKRAPLPAPAGGAPEPERRRRHAADRRHDRRDLSHRHTRMPLASYDVVVSEMGKELARVRVNFAALR